MNLRRYLNRVTRRHVVVNLKSGTSIKGVLFAAYRDVLVIRHAAIATPKAREFVDADGEQLIERHDVDWIQLLEPGEAS